MSIIDKTILFSLQSGGYSGGRKSYDSIGKQTLKGAGIGGGIGAGLGALTGGKQGAIGGGVSMGILGALIGLANGISNKHKTKVKESYNTVDLINGLITYYTDQGAHIPRNSTEALAKYGIYVDRDPEKCDVALYAIDGHLMMYVDSSSRAAVNYVNDALDDICHQYHKATYTSSKFKNGYLVDFLCPDLSTASSFLGGFGLVGVVTTILLSSTKFLNK